MNLRRQYIPANQDLPYMTPFVKDLGVFQIIVGNPQSVALRLPPMGHNTNIFA